ncbi:unnamed protein product [Urochloa humidicola]
MDPQDTGQGAGLSSDAESSAFDMRSTRKTTRKSTLSWQQRQEEWEENAHEADFASDTQSWGVSNTSIRSQVQTVFSVDAVHRVFSLFNEEKRKIVESIGFGGLLKLHPQVKFPRLLVLWLVRNMDPNTGTISLSNGDKLPVNERDVHLVLGLPHTKKTVERAFPLSMNDVSRVKEILMLGHGVDITLENIKTILQIDYGSKMTERQIEAFKVAVVLYADAYFMGPKGAKVRVNQEILRNLTNTACIEQLNWCGYVLGLLLQSAKRVQKSVNSGKKSVILDGCLFFWVVYYLDNVDFGFMYSPSKMLPRIVDYPYAIVKRLVQDDSFSNNSTGMKEYGRNKLRPHELGPHSGNKGQYNTSTDKGELQCNINDIIEAINNWEVSVQKATAETREAMIGYLKSSRKLAEDGQSATLAEFCPQVNPDTHNTVGEESATLAEFCPQVNADTHDTVGEDDNKDIDGHNPEDWRNKDYLDVPEYEPEYYIISDSDDSNENANVHPGFDGIGRGNSETRSFTWSTDREAENDHQLHMELELYAKECESDGRQMIACADEDCMGRNTYLTVALNDEVGDQTMVINDIIVDATYFRSQSRFGVSPFMMGLEHRDAPLEAQLKLEKALRQLSDEDKYSIWYIHDIPTTLQIDGRLLQGMFGGSFDMSTETMNAIVRLYHQMDDEMYARWTEKRWRHFLPADFAIAAFRGDEEYLDSDEVTEMFVNYHITYRVGDCRLVMAPLLLHWHWCLYVWDFERNVIVVVDPMSMKLSGHKVAEKHKHSLDIMHKALQKCKEMYFEEQNGSMEGWEVEYLDIPGAQGDSNNTGFTTMFCARYFDGKYLTRILTPEATRLQKCSMLYQLITMFGNMGQPPSSIMDAINASYCIEN